MDFFSEVSGQVQTHAAIEPGKCEVEVEQNKPPLSLTSPQISVKSKL